MKPLKCPWRFASKCFLVPAVIFVVLFIRALLSTPALGEGVLRGEAYFNFPILSGVWLAVCIGFFAFSQIGSSKLKRLKEEGTFYEGIVEKLRPVWGVRLFHYITLRADCSYMNQEGNKCLVRSRAFLYGNISLIFPRSLGMYEMNVNAQIQSGMDKKLRARIYVNPADPTDYAVEMFESLG